MVAAVLLASSVLTPAMSVSPVAADSGARMISSGGTAKMVSRASGPDAGVQAPEFAMSPDQAREGAAGSSVQLRQGAGPSPGITAEGVQVNISQNVRSGTGVRTGFDGLNFRQQRLANGGKQFSVEPPDQSMCIGNGFVVESVNDVLQVFDTSGNARTDVIDLNTFYGYPPQIVRATPANPVAVQGPFVTDPSCWFDAPTQRFFHVVLTLEVVPSGPLIGRFTGENHLDLAVSNTSDPTRDWSIYRLPVQDDGMNGTPDHRCSPGSGDHPERTHPNACIGDFPHIGADKYGIYLSTNEYCLFCPGIGFRAAQVYAFDKFALASLAPSVQVTQFDTIGALNGQPGFTLWPATSPGDSEFELGGGGTEYFTSSNAAEEATGVPNSSGTNRSNRIGVWALMNTSSLKTASPNLSLRNTTVRVSQYSVPGLSNQKPGDFPLGQCLNDTTMPTLFGPGCWQWFFVVQPKPEVEGSLDSSDSRVLSTVFANGLLWGTLDTGVRVGGKTKAGILYYMIEPRLVRNGVRAELKRQGHVSVVNNNAIFGAIAATRQGRAVIGFTLVGDDHYPSAAYVSLNVRRDDENNNNNNDRNDDEDFSSLAQTRRSDIHIVAEGKGPQDGFTEYNAYADSGIARPRWGDYGAAVATSDTTIWVANEYIAQTCTLAQYYPNPPSSIGLGSCGATRTSLGNWATRLTAIDVTH
jgi:hypothetical protein